MMSEYDEKRLYEDTIECPHCGKRIDVVLVRTTVTPTVMGTYKKRFEVFKNPQTKLTIEK